MKRLYHQPTCVVVKLATQCPCMLNGSYRVTGMGTRDEQEVGGDE